MPTYKRPTADEIERVATYIVGRLAVKGIDYSGCEDRIRALATKIARTRDNARGDDVAATVQLWLHQNGVRDHAMGTLLRAFLPDGSTMAIKSAVVRVVSISTKPSNYGGEYLAIHMTDEHDRVLWWYSASTTAQAINDAFFADQSVDVHMISGSVKEVRGIHAVSFSQALWGCNAVLSNLRLLEHDTISFTPSDPWWTPLVGGVERTDRKSLVKLIEAQEKAAAS